MVVPLSGVHTPTRSIIRVSLSSLEDLPLRRVPTLRTSSRLETGEDG